MPERKIPKSEALFTQSKLHLVGGVNSPVRAFGGVGGTPRFIDRAEGPYLYDVDGNEYIDFVGSWGAMILGHAVPTVIEKVTSQLSRGSSYGAPTAIENHTAAIIKDAFPSIEKLRFTSSGTEATMSALRLSRAATKRERILKFEGGYHGHSDGLLVSAGSGATTFGIPSSAGVPESLAKNTWVLPYNDIVELESIFRTQGPNIAAAIIEPVCGNMGVVVPKTAFLEKLRKLCTKYGVILIFDEVITGFRLDWGGAQKIFGVSPDITCLGKIIGGGFPVGAFGGSTKIMDLLAPLGPVYQAGTLSGNPVAMTAGLATLEILKAKKPYEGLGKRTQELTEAVVKTARKKKIDMQVNQTGSMFTFFFAAEPVTNYFSALQSDKKKFAKFFHALLERGVYMPPSQFEAAFVSVAHTPPVMQKAKEIFEAALSQMAS